MAESKLNSRVVKNIQIAAVNHHAFVPLVYRIVQVEDIRANQSIISFHYHCQLSQLAVICYRIINIERRLSIVFVGNYLNFIRRYLSAHYVAFYILSCFVLRSVINIYYVVICIILHEN